MTKKMNNELSNDELSEPIVNGELGLQPSEHSEELKEEVSLEEHGNLLKGDETNTSSNDFNESSDETSPELLPKKQGRARAILKILRNVIAALLVAAAVVVLIVNFIYPVMRIYGSSMSSTLVDGDIVIARKTTELERGDICAFNYGSRVLCKRVVGLGGDEIEIDNEGTVYVNGAVLDEPYLKGKSLGDCDIEFPYTVPEDSYFVLGDNRRASIDSRNTVIGCVSKEQVIGKLEYCILPFPSFGKIQ